ncbi:MAG: hypothetical protein GY832_26045 [Chloroflexi bacterium]|nr:hypothetical protein [Chloroflexota bacterium]
MPELECQFCGWLGDPQDLMDAHGQRVCPECGSDTIEDYEHDKDESVAVASGDIADIWGYDGDHWD